MAFARGFGFGRLAATASGGTMLTDTIADFKYDLDFIANTYKGGFQTYGNNTDDGRFFLDITNSVATYCENADGTLVFIGGTGCRRTTAGIVTYSGSTLALIQNRDLTQAIWTKTNVTALKDQVGRDGNANTASSITATSANGTCLQAVTQTIRAFVFYCDIKRLVGTGTLEYTLDGGATWTVVTTTAAYTRPLITQTLANPTIGFRIGTSGDSFAVDFVMAHLGPNGQVIPNGYRVAVGASVGSGLSGAVPSANINNLGPLAAVAQGPFAFYWEGDSERPSTLVPFSLVQGDVQMGCQIVTNGAASFQGAITGTGQWLSAIGLGVGSRNKCAGYVTANGLAKVCLNGNAVAVNNAATLAPSLNHFDIGTNGAAALAIHGNQRRFCMSPRLTFSDAALIAMTT